MPNMFWTKTDFQKPATSINKIIKTCHIILPILIAQTVKNYWRKFCPIWTNSLSHLSYTRKQLSFSYYSPCDICHEIKPATSSYLSCLHRLWRINEENFAQYGQILCHICRTPENMLSFSDYSPSDVCHKMTKSRQVDPKPFKSQVIDI